MRRHVKMLILLRIFLAFVILIPLLTNQWDIAFFIFLFTIAIAFLDGFLTKRHKQVSQFRSILDPFADKILILSVAGMFWYQGFFPLIAYLIYLGKELIIFLAAVIILLRKPNVIFRSNIFDKTCSFVQFLVLIMIFLGKPDVGLFVISVLFIVVSLIVSAFRSGIKVVEKSNDFEDIQFRKLLKLPDYLTLLNILMGLACILFASSDDFLLASIFLILAVVFDYLDGKAARWQGPDRDFGKQLDSLADTISFGVAPAIFGYSLIQTPLAKIIFALFIFAGVLRLARYNIMEFTGDFAGMPITVNGVVIPLLFFTGVPVLYYPYVYLFLALAMISPLKIKKMF
ncbi:MAG: CDP-diacylglycerol--serine O-phosphatidyltransferase [Nanoarchaeota archaeon]|nr:CDP-diacylglycerol--serine O-phosphatidyltransferase [Nanoarchaeota archaeon]